ncbi:MAG TPA: DUF4232 domain-containing protein [Pseudonocardiaceae bacterium]|jgi:hypothetical protein|nr:DUF4232 domain-containing protein [Pseudonocardiaceae bacterium]
MSVTINRRIVARTLLAATGVLAAVSLAACNGTATGALSVSSPTTTGTQSTVQTTVADAPSQPYTAPVGSSPGTAAPGAAAPGNAAAGTPARHAPATVTSTATPECRSNVLRLSFGGGDAGMSQQYRVLRFTNVGKRSCFVVGFPGVSYVTGDNGRQVGAPAVREGHIGARVVLAPRQVASTVIHSVDVGVFDASQCKPTTVRGYRIYPPDETRSMFIALSGGVRGCAGTSPDPQLSVYTIKRGPGSPDQP